MASRSEIEAAIAALSGSSAEEDKDRIRKLQRLLGTIQEDTLMTDRTFQTGEQIVEQIPTPSDVPTAPGPDYDIESIRAARLAAGREDMQGRYEDALSKLQTPPLYQQWTTPQMGELYGQSAATMAMLPFLLNPTTTLPAAALMIPAETAAGVGVRNLFSRLPWNEPTRAEEQSIGEMGSWNPLEGSFWSGGTGALGAVERGVKYGALGHSLGPLLSGTAQATRRGILGFKPGKYEFDPFSPIGKWGVPFLGRQALKAEDRELIEAHIRRYEELGLEAPAYLISQRAMLRGLPALAKVPFLGYGVAKQITDAIGGTRKFFMDKLIELSPVLTKNQISHDMFLASKDWTARQIRAYGKLYDDAFKFIETGGPVRGLGRVEGKAHVWGGVGDRPIFDLSPMHTAVDNILGKGAALRPMVPQGVRDWIENEVSNVARNVSVREFRDIQSTVGRALRGKNPGDEGFEELVKLQESLKESLKGLERTLGPEIGKQASANFQLANDAVLRYMKMLRTPEARKFRQIEGAWGEHRFADPRSGTSFEKLGTRNVEELFDMVFKTGGPDHFATLKTILGSQKAWDQAVVKKLDSAINKASGMSPGKGYATFNEDVFRKALNLDEGDDMLKAMLNGTNMTVKDIDNVAVVLGQHPVTPEIMQMMIRRVGLSGPKSLATLGVGGIIAKSGSGILSAATMPLLAVILATRQAGKFLSSPTMIQRLTKLGKTEKQLAAGKTARSTYGYALTQAVRTFMEISGAEERLIEEEIGRIRIALGQTLREYAAATGSRYQ